MRIFILSTVLQVDYIDQIKENKMNRKLIVNLEIRAVQNILFENPEVKTSQTLQTLMQIGDNI
jgi:hypothetical protein